jgi:hypothetical protein
MGRTVTLASWSGGSGTATRAPGGRGERPVGWRVCVVPGLGEIAPVFVSEGNLNTRSLMPPPPIRDGSFEPQIVRKRQRRLTGVDEIVLPLYAKGLATGEISAHFAEIYGASVSKETISRITDKVLEEMQSWQARPLDGVYAAVFIDAIMVKVRDGQVANRPLYAAIGVSLAGEKDILGLWAGTGGEGCGWPC